VAAKNIGDIAKRAIADGGFSLPNIAKFLGAGYLISQVLDVAGDVISGGPARRNRELDIAERQGKAQAEAARRLLDRQIGLDKEASARESQDRNRRIISEDLALSLSGIPGEKEIGPGPAATLTSATQPDSDAFMQRALELQKLESQGEVITPLMALGVI